MKRTPLQRKTPLKRGESPKRRSGLWASVKRLLRRVPLRTANTARRRRRFEKAYGSRERVLWVRSLPCLVCHRTPSENAHVRSRGAGGTADDIVPLCRAHHAEQHALGLASFCRLHGLDLGLAAFQVAVLWLAQEGGQ